VFRCRNICIPCLYIVITLEFFLVEKSVGAVGKWYKLVLLAQIRLTDLRSADRKSSKLKSLDFGASVEKPFRVCL